MDWIQGYLELTEGLPTPATFRLWSAIFAIGAAMERKTWCNTAFGQTWPNMFMLLVGPPGSGKTVAMTPAKRLLAHSKSVMLAADDMTKAALLDELVEHSRRVLYKGETIVYHPLCVMVSEFGTLVNAHDLEFFSLLSDLFDNKDTPHKSRRRGHNMGKSLEISKPNINILAGTQPGFLSQLLPPGAWQQGFTSRLLMVYAPGAPEVDMFAEMDDRSQLFAELARGLSERAKLLGPFKISEGAKDAMRLWVSGGMKPVPEHERLEHYRARRAMHVLKLAMIAASSARGTELEILAEDFERALSWLKAAESVMPDIFRDMAEASDSLLLGELHRFAWDLWVKSSPKVEQRKAVHRAMLMRFLALKCPAEKALKVLEMACFMQWLEQVPDSLLYIPKARGFSSDAAS